MADYTRLTNGSLVRKLAREAMLSGWYPGKGSHVVELTEVRRNRKAIREIKAELLRRLGNPPTRRSTAR